MTFPRIGTLALFAFLAACGGSEAPAPTPAEVPEPEAAPEAPELDKAALEASACLLFTSPSPRD